MLKEGSFSKKNETTLPKLKNIMQHYHLHFSNILFIFKLK